MKKHPKKTLLRDSTALKRAFIDIFKEVSKLVGKNEAEIERLSTRVAALERQIAAK